MKKDCKVILLQTNEKAHFDDLVIHPINKELFKFQLQNCTEFAQHLYIISDEEIKVGDWRLENDHIYRTLDSETTRWANENGCKKIIATTDTSLQIKHFNSGVFKDLLYNLPQIPQHFIEKYTEEYNNGNVIDDIKVEYEFVDCEGKLVHPSRVQDGCGIRLKINSDNTINISTQKEIYSGEEVVNLIKEYHAYSTRYLDLLDKWIEENL